LQISVRGLIAEGRLAAAIAATLLVVGCAAPEQSLLEQFFGASRLRDTTALQAVSTVIFEPLQQGIVRTFRITGTTAEQANGHTVTKDVTIDAAVILPDGRTLQKTLAVTLQHASGDESGRWIVAGVRDAGPARPAPQP
jgi:hypothetical protein